MSTSEGAATPATYREQVAPLVAAYLEGLAVLDDLLQAALLPNARPAGGSWPVETAPAMGVLWRAAEQLAALSPVPPEHVHAAALWPRLATATKQLVRALARWSDHRDPAALQTVVEQVGRLRPLAAEVDRLFPAATAEETP